MLREMITECERWAEDAIDVAPTYERDVLTVVPHEVSLSDEQDGLLRTVESGWDGTYYIRGRRTHTGDHPEYDRPIVARGLGSDLGVLEELYKTSPQYRRAVLTIAQGVETAIWNVSACKTCPDNLADFHEVQRAFVQKTYDALEGGFRSFLHEAVRGLLVAGFAVFQRVDREDGSVRKLAYRRSNTISRWILNEHETDLLAVEFRDAHGSYYVVPAEHLLIISFDAVGLDFEGLSPLRTAAPYIRAKQLLLQLQMSAQEKYASPIIWIEDEQGDTSDAERFVSIWDSLSATDFACITGRKGQKATILHPSSSMPDYEPKLRYLDEQILLPLSSEGALIGTQDHGSYALSEVKDSQHMRVAIYIAQIIQDALHGTNMRPYTGVTQKIIDHAFGGPIHPHAYPMMSFSLGEEEVPLSDILAAAQRGPHRSHAGSAGTCDGAPQAPCIDLDSIP